MAVRLYDGSERPARPMTLDDCYRHAYGDLRALLQRVCDDEVNDYEWVRARVEQTAVRLERNLQQLVPGLEGIYSLARPLS